MTKIVGFTGTQRGMTLKQRDKVVDLLLDIKPQWGIHGDCIGADRDFNKICRTLNIKTEAYPGTDHYGRSPKRAYCRVNLCHPPKPYLVRNSLIVGRSNAMIATPGEVEEQLRSGTWSTIRTARRNPNTYLYVILPDGSYL